jgi:predicted Rossmann-fold nucleotide-binding protein
MKPPSKLVGVFGSSRIGPNKFLFSQAYQAGYTLVRNGWTVVTGGGEGLSAGMVAGGSDAAMQYFGNQHENEDYPFVGLFADTQDGRAYVRPTTPEEEEEHKYFVLVDSLYECDAYMFLPGGYGTMCELMKVLAAMNRGEMERKPVVVVGTTLRNQLMRLMHDGLKSEVVGNTEVYHSFYEFPTQAADAICKSKRSA